MTLQDSEAAVDDDGLDVVALSDTAWRVTDARFAKDAQGLLSYLERVDDHVVVSIFSPPPLADVVVDCFAAALRLLRQRVES